MPSAFTNSIGASILATAFLLQGSLVHADEQSCFKPQVDTTKVYKAGDKIPVTIDQDMAHGLGGGYQIAHVYFDETRDKQDTELKYNLTKHRYEGEITVPPQLRKKWNLTVEMYGPKFTTFRATGGQDFPNPKISVAEEKPTPPGIRITNLTSYRIDSPTKETKANVAQVPQYAIEGDFRVQIDKDLLRKGGSEAYGMTTIMLATSKQSAMVLSPADCKPQGQILICHFKEILKEATTGREKLVLEAGDHLDSARVTADFKVPNNIPRSAKTNLLSAGLTVLPSGRLAEIAHVTGGTDQDKVRFQVQGLDADGNEIESKFLSSLSCNRDGLCTGETDMPRFARNPKLFRLIYSSESFDPYQRGQEKATGLFPDTFANAKRGFESDPDYNSEPHMQVLTPQTACGISDGLTIGISRDGGVSNTHRTTAVQSEFR